jgi:hypothetical protein
MLLNIFFNSSDSISKEDQLSSLLPKAIIKRSQKLDSRISFKEIPILFEKSAFDTAPCASS